MSYDLMVFEPEAAPKEHQAFMRWYFGFTKWNEGHSYNDLSVTSQRLRSWLVEMQQTYPDMNSLEAADLLPEDDGSLSDYSIGKQAIYACFAWSKAEKAYSDVFELAAKHGVGFFDVSSAGEEVWMPDNGQLKQVHQKEPPGLLSRVAKLFGKKLR